MIATDTKLGRNNMSDNLIDELADAYRPIEAQKLLRISAPAMARWIITGRIRSIKLGSKRFIPRSAINELIEASMGGGPGTTPATGKAPRRRSATQKAAAVKAANERSQRLGC
jgi:excisionase family DNA binding protein